MTAIGAGGQGAAAHPPARTVRRARRAAMRRFRPRRIVPATIAAAVLLAVSLLVLIEVVSGLVGRPARIIPYDAMLRWAATTRWNEAAVLTGAAIVALVGLLLLLLGLVPGRPSHVPLRTEDPELIMGMQRRSFARALERAAETVPGVTRARARMRGGRVLITASSAMHDPGGLEQSVREAVYGKLRSLAPAVEPPVDVKVRRK
ncbi:hypothetical protein HNP84_002263 [Thermocatellispora tengchongensis]|uniref:DUF6286 domain-containing protein n=1 Tax=Thermocatellispora tengchongensis TaxID=1073253 RepID=A0A840P5P8_9ACTN|nr:DUF6286 domain-containing protein [Thermocatellispora tengchongensis]MBB5132547.1 hypothetical protein [Thermocatellispora tengchongensis]